MAHLAQLCKLIIKKERAATAILADSQSEASKLGHASDSSCTAPYIPHTPHIPGTI